MITVPFDKETVEQTLADNECLVPKCGRMAKSRGLCGACYQAAKTLVDSGKTTWEELEERKRVLPSRRETSGGRDNWFLGNE